MTRRLLSLASAVLVALAVTGCAGGPASEPVASTLHGDVPATAVPRPHFTLTDTGGATYDFAGRTRGRVTLLFWGYTRCPDTCPATLHSISIALHRVPAEVRGQVSVVFITSDPRRDSAPVIRRWLDGIDPSFVGLTGTPAQIAAAEDAAGVPHAQPETVGAADYTVDHYAGTTAFGRDDRVAVRYPTTAGARDFGADLPVLVGAKAAA